ncbi:kinase-like domain-containing protein [Coniochaeta sp. 2T2.1]|nr:kinase-like domain-containing protein [Coniochaeta sp. 2T2.1]
MSASPLVAYPKDALKPERPDSSKPTASPLKRPISTAPPSSDGTPRPAVQTQPVRPRAKKDLAEQMNDEEKHKWVKGKKLGEGTYANVFAAHLRSDPSQKAAIKKIKVQQAFKDGMAPDALREIKHLQELNHPNIVRLISVFSSKDQNLNLVLEYLPLGDLEDLIKNIDTYRYSHADIKAWMGMLCRGVWWCHENFVLHRDIKPNNILIAANGEAKLADFGLARSFSDPGLPMSSQVITIWYRPPELLLGAKHYSGAVDIWSVGCVFAELVVRAPFLPGGNESEQLGLICKLIGTPTEDNWPKVTTLGNYAAVGAEVHPVTPREGYMARFSAVGADGVDLLMKTLTLDPKKRITARGMLDHKWFRSEPRPTSNENLPRQRSGGVEKMAADLKRVNPMEDDKDGRGAKVARKLDFGAMKK